MATSRDSGPSTAVDPERPRPRPVVLRAKDTVRRRLQQVVDLGPDGPVAALRARVSALAYRTRFRSDDGDGIVPESWFARIYEDSDDPWGYGTSAYEARRYALTLAALPRQHYARAYEPGCAIGELSAGLAPRCDRLICADYSPAAVARARARLAAFEHVSVERHELPADFPDQHFDLIVLGDLGMYLSPARLDELTDKAVASLRGGGHLVAVHGHHLSPDIFQSGDQVHNRIRRHPALAKLAGYRDRALRLDVWERRP